MKNIFTSLFLNCILVVSLAGQWLPTNGPYGQEITTLEKLSEDSLLVGTKNSGLFLHIISKTEWINVYSMENYNSIYSSVITPQKNVLLIAEDMSGIDFPRIVKIERGLQNWKSIGQGPLGNFAVVKDENVNKILLHDKTDGLYCSYDEGETWSYSIVPQNIYGIRDIKFDPKIGRIYIATDPTIELNKSINAGNNILYVDNGIVISDDYANSWQTLYEESFDKIFVHDSLLLARLVLHHGGNYLQSSDFGVSWVHSESSERFEDIVFDSNGNCYAACMDGLYFSTDNGTNWELINSEVRNLTKLEVISDSSLYISSLNGLYSYTIKGNSIEDKTLGLFTTGTYTLYCSSNDVLTGGGYSGGIFYSTNKGNHWIYDDNNIKGRDNEWGSVYDIAESSNGRLFAATSYEDVLYYKDDNINGWQKFYLDSNIPVEYWAIAIDSKDRVYIGTNKDGIYSVNSDGSDQTILPLNHQSISSLYIDADDNIYAGSSWGTIFNSSDNGENWIAYSEGLNGQPVISIQGNEELYAATINDVLKFSRLNNAWISIAQELPDDVYIVVP